MREGREALVFVVFAIILMVRMGFNSLASLLRSRDSVTLPDTTNRFNPGSHQFKTSQKEKEVQLLKLSHTVLLIISCTAASWFNFILLINTCWQRMRPELAKPVPAFLRI